MSTVLELAGLLVIIVGIWTFWFVRVKMIQDAARSGNEGERAERSGQWEEILRVIQAVEQTGENMTSKQKRETAIVFIQKAFPDLPSWKVDVYLESAVQAWKTARAAAENGAVDEIVRDDE